MNPIMSVCCISLLLLSFVGAKPISDPQSLKHLFEEEINTTPYYSSEEMEVEGTEQHTSSDPRNSILAAKENVLVRLFKDLVKTSKRSWSRYKKGGLRSCFGVRLERIGSFSGLGC